MYLSFRISVLYLPVCLTANEIYIPERTQLIYYHLILQYLLMSCLSVRGFSTAFSRISFIFTYLRWGFFLFCLCNTIIPAMVGYETRGKWIWIYVHVPCSYHIRLYVYVGTQFPQFHPDDVYKNYLNSVQ